MIPASLKIEKRGRERDQPEGKIDSTFALLIEIGALLIHKDDVEKERHGNKQKKKDIQRLVLIHKDDVGKERDGNK